MTEFSWKQLPKREAIAITGLMLLVVGFALAVAVSNEYSLAANLSAGRIGRYEIWNEHLEVVRTNDLRAYKFDPSQKVIGTIRNRNGDLMDGVLVRIFRLGLQESDAASFASLGLKRFAKEPVGGNTRAAKPLGYQVPRLSTLELRTELMVTGQAKRT